MPIRPLSSPVLDYAGAIQVAGKPFVPSWPLLRVSSTIGLTGLSIAMAARLTDHGGLFHLLVFWWTVGGGAIGCAAIAALLDIGVALDHPANRARGAVLAGVVCLGVLANVALVAIGGFFLVYP